MSHLSKTLKKFTPVSDVEIDFAAGLATTKKFKKGEKLFQDGEHCNVLTIIEEGFAVMYHEKAGLRKGVVGFYKEGHYITDFYSYLTKEPVNFNFHFVEDTRLSVISKENLELLNSRSPNWQVFGRVLAEKAYLNEMKHLYDAKYLSKDDLYKKLVEQQNFVLQRAPLYLIASYLNTTPETLSRIRRRIYEEHKM